MPRPANRKRQLDRRSHIIRINSADKVQLQVGTNFVMWGNATMLGKRRKEISDLDHPNFAVYSLSSYWW